jgi:hypothetical protein
MEKTIAEKVITSDGIATNKIGRSRFIQVEGVSTCKQNCSVSRGIPARSREYPQFLGCTNKPAGGVPGGIFVAFRCYCAQPTAPTQRARASIPSTPPAPRPR